MIYEFFKIYRSEFDNIVSCVKETISDAKSNESDINRKSGDDLYTSIEVARKLLEILGNDNVEAIASKTGLDIGIVKSLISK